MKSFLREMEEKFLDLDNYCDQCNQSNDQCNCDAEIDEASTSGAVAGYNVPGAFLTPAQYEKKKKKIKYESINTPTSRELDSYKATEDKKDKIISITIEDVLEKKYEQLIESYRTYANGDAKTTPEQKIKETIKSVAKQLQEIEKTINYASKLKTESGVNRTGYGPAVESALNKISNRLIKISERVRSLGE